MPKNIAATNYQIPRDTLERYLKSGNHEHIFGRQPILNKEQKKLIQREDL